MPSYWQGYARNHLLAPALVDASNPQADTAVEAGTSSSTGNDKPYSIGGAVMKPSVLYQTEPQFSRAARSLKFSGVVQVYLWVLPDGSPSHLRITKPAGLGLDEQAILAVSKYKFKPATKDGKPLTVYLYIEVNFQIIN
jgi:periplasmic protein TonB